MCKHEFSIKNYRTVLKYSSVDLSAPPCSSWHRRQPWCRLQGRVRAEQAWAAWQSAGSCWKSACWRRQLSGTSGPHAQKWRLMIPAHLHHSVEEDLQRAMHYCNAIISKVVYNKIKYIYSACTLIFHFSIIPSIQKYCSRTQNHYVILSHIFPLHQGAVFAVTLCTLTFTQ